ncbi:MAG TPA: MMPL family transporter [Candidatus Dormibacteraeota bacterium]|jgi:RND superfamily putative drug exporter|nr:MMPL family transporter [Candidatus Dormibacteraeota bacterium]
MRFLGSLLVRRSWAVLAVTAVVLAVAALIGSSAESHLSTGGFTDPSWESSRALATLQSTFRTTQPNIVLLVTAKSGTVTDPVVAQAGANVARRLAGDPGVVDVTSFWSTPPQPSLASRDGRQALVTGRATGDENTTRATAERIAAGFDGSSGPVTVTAGGTAVAQAEIVSQSAADLHRAELITVPITGVLLVLLFGSAVGAMLPLVVGGVAIVGTLFLLRLLTGVTDVSIFALNVTTGMGLGLGVDYSLLIVSRYREELRAGRARERALMRTLQTAGRTVLFSAVTVAIALASLAVFPIAFLRSFAYAGVGVVALAALGAVVVLPAVLHILGPRIEMGRLPSRGGGDGRFWYRRAHAVMRHPVLVAVGVVVILAVMGSPFLRISLGDDDERILPPTAAARVVGDALRSNFADNPSSRLAVVAAQAAGADASAVRSYALLLSAVPNVARVDAAAGHFAGGRQVAPADATAAVFTAPGATWLAVTPAVDPISPAGVDLAKAVRSTPAPFPVLVGGSAATLLDSRDSMLGHLPIAITVIVVATVLLLFLMVGAVLVPLKTLVLNVLSLSATFGALVFVFQDGHLSGLLGFTSTGTISIRTPVLLFCFAFGLSMDYEVFLISRIKEEYDRIGNNEEAVALGLQHTGRLVTSAALLISIVFLAFLTSGVTTIKVLGLGLALAVLVDAFLVRATLVPALMRLLGDRNWWAPRSLRRLHLLVGIWEREPLAILDVGSPVRLDHTRD